MYQIRNSLWKTDIQVQLHITSTIVLSGVQRKKILTGGIEQFLDDMIRDISSKHDWDVLELKVMPDHVHLFLGCNPVDSPARIAKTLKGIAGLHMFRQFPELRQKLWKGILWSLILCWDCQSCIC